MLIIEEKDEMRTKIKKYLKVLKKFRKTPRGLRMLELTNIRSLKRTEYLGRINFLNGVPVWI